MTEYEVAYRLYSSAELTGYGQIGGARIRQRSTQSAVDGELVFTVGEDSKSEAASLAADEIREEARTVVGLLSLISDEGVILGQAYPPVKTDRQVKTKTDVTSQMDELAYGIADKMYGEVRANFDHEERTVRALHWFSIGLNTETPEDRLVAFWTGLEAAVEQKVKYSGDELEKYEEAKEAVQEIVGEYEELQNGLMGLFGFAKKESIAEALQRVFEEELEAALGQNEEQCSSLEDKIKDIKNARNSVLHQGESVNSASEKARDAKRLLKEFIEYEFDNIYSSLADADSLPELDQGRNWHPVMDDERIVQEIFENSSSNDLSEREIRKRAFAMLRDYREVQRFKLNELVGLGKPLAPATEGGYRYAPTPGWLSKVHQAILQYTYAAGRVPLEVITKNVNSGDLSHVLNDIDTDNQTVRECCEDFCEIGLMEEEDGFLITLDGRMVFEGRNSVDQFSSPSQQQ